MIRKPFTKLNSMIQSRLRLLAEKFSTSTVNVVSYKFVRSTKHNKKIQELQKEYNKFKKTPVTRIRASGVVLFSVLSIALFWLIYKNPYEWVMLKQITKDTKNIISLTTLIITAPIVFVIWVFRDENKLLELENARKDTNLKEFQQLQRWATGNIDGNSDNDNDNKIALQISALHSLRTYLKGEYGESFRRGAYEIFRAILATQHQKILQQLKNDDSKTIKEFENNDSKTITDKIDSCPLTRQLNIIASEEWFNLLINHNFPTKGISLVGVDLSHTYLHHRTYGETLDLQDAQLQGANLTYVLLQGADLQSAQLQGANLWGTQLQGANLWGTQLQGAGLETAQLQGADLGVAQLQGANLTYAKLQGANLNGTQLQGADLQSAQLQGAYLRDAQLQWAGLWETQLQGAYTEASQWINFKQTIKWGINKETESQNLKEQCKALNDTDKSKLIAELKAINSVSAVNAISRIQAASEILDLLEATTGKYSQEKANEWLNDYKKARYYVF
ncbi:pentapeptide repeat family protein [Bathymodiolus heckerae thiotrophic gill symbiont]|uniref:pentapeptide repeat-containing protein n=1 Tax=Bathymodiolus heckerae thiotrophic gill symbiont TaxID=1052212 RepID=UPI0010B80EE3|nr:pentapeptide repeat-containing protein [Bathymodiolus heckerae thiotrophic gill symbiont]SMN13288.1 pentapeptide repeat family protein [Bathymodiolus heckerae thiotrophic gill symbiont]